MKKFLARGWAREDRAVVCHAEQVRPHIDFGGVAKPPRPQLNVLESFAVGPESSVVVYSARNVCPVDRTNLALRRWRKIHNAEGLLRIGDGLLDLRRLPRECPDSAK